jgi:catechol 2,3-dioxygenase-like lactoylglutathione lyase family enzyme
MDWCQDHIHIRCKDYENTARFFKDCFDAEEISRSADGEFAIVSVNVGGVIYSFSPPKPGETVDADTHTLRYGVSHLALRTSNLGAAMERVKQHRAKVVSDITVIKPGLRVSFVESPDGIVVELVQRD